MSEAEVEIFKKEQRPPAPSVLYRYPTKTGSAEWEGAFGFEASSYMPVVHALSKDISKAERVYHLTMRCTGQAGERDVSNQENFIHS